MKAPTLPLTLLSTHAPVPQDGEAQVPSTPAESGAEGAPPTPGLFDNILFPIVACIAVFWLIVIRPEKRQRKAREAMLNALKKGDEVVTSGGIHGTVAQVKDDVVTVQVADGVRLRFGLHAVQNKQNEDEPEEKKGEKGEEEEK